MALVKSSIVKKQVMGVTGLLLCGFLIGHLAGNLLIYVGPEAFNKYAHTLTSNPLIYGAEAGLIALFFSHLFLAGTLTLENKTARPVNYYVRMPTGRGSTLASSTMPYTGAVVLVFVVLHILQFKYGAYYSTTYDGVEMRDLYKLVLEHFQSPIAVIWYIVSMICITFHLWHGAWSAFQSIGFGHPRYTPLLRVAAKGLALLLGVGFSSFPIYCYMQGA